MANKTEVYVVYSIYTDPDEHDGQFADDTYNVEAVFTDRTEAEEYVTRETSRYDSYDIVDLVLDKEARRAIGMNPTGRTTKTTDDTGTYTVENDTLASSNPNGERVSAEGSTASTKGVPIGKPQGGAPERDILHDDGELEVLNGDNKQA